MVKYILGKVMTVVEKKPFRLWGMSLLSGLLIALASIFGVLPIISIPITLVLQLGMAAVFLAGYRGKDFNSDDLFKGFKDFGRCAGGMAWMTLWIFIWALIPIAGPVFAIIKMYSYRFTPYILAEDKSVTATEALRRSMKMTQGYKGKMFGAEILVYLIFFAACLVLGLLSLIPYAGILFSIVLVIVGIVFAAVAPLVYGLIRAAFYDEVAAGVDPQKFAALKAQRDMEKQMKAQMKLQMQMQQQQMQAQLQQQMQQQQQQMQQQIQQQQQQMQQQMQQNNPNNFPPQQ